jgi:hypothetical protein
VGRQLALCPGAFKAGYKEIFISLSLPDARMSQAGHGAAATRGERSSNAAFLMATKRFFIMLKRA